MQTINDDDKTVTIGADGTINVHRNHHDSFDGLSFLFAAIAGAIVALLVMRLIGLRAKRLPAKDARVAAAASGQRDFETEYHALAKRTATLERIITDPAVRVHNEIEALR
ncbi:hypothetical protein [Glacieibacterium sp.]|uniref:hypothetical protein n=1 Tax=Glacieibacterium sp. TaxID=2860237 RepID=UPI003B00B2CE